MKHFVFIAFIMLFCFAVLPEFFITDKVKNGNEGNGISQIETILDKNEANSKTDEKTGIKASANIEENQNKSTKAKENEIKENEAKKNDLNERDKKLDNEDVQASKIINLKEEKENNENSSTINEYIVESEDESNVKTTKVAENVECEAEKKVEATENEDAKNCTGCVIDKNQAQNANENENQSQKTNQIIEDEKKEEGGWLKKNKENELNHSALKMENDLENDKKEILPKSGLFEGGLDNIIIESNCLKDEDKQEKINKDEQVSKKSLPIEDKMIKEHKKDRAKKEVPGTSKIENSKKLDLNKEQPIYDVELLGIIDNATVIMNEGIVNVKFGV